MADVGLKTLLSAVAAASAVGSAVELSGLLCTNHYITIKATGTVPTNATIKIYTSIDGTNFDLAESHTATFADGPGADTNIISLLGYGAKFLKGEFSAKTGGDTTTRATVTSYSTTGV